MLSTNKSKTLQVDILLRALGQDELNKVIDKYNRAKKYTIGGEFTDEAIAIAKAWITGELDNKEAMRQMGVKSEPGLYGRVGKIMRFVGSNK